jgi:hypothetical protein
MVVRMRVLLAALVPALLLPGSAGAALPGAEGLLKAVGYSAEEIATIESGSIVRRETRGAGARDLTVGYAFFVKATPASVNKQLSDGVLQAIDPNSIATATLTGESSVDAFATLKLKPDTAARVARYQSARPGTRLNLSSAEIAAFNELAPGDTQAVERQVRASLLERYRAYRARGLAGIVDYDRGEGQVRSPGDELTAVMMNTSQLQTLAPKAWEAMLNYPAAKVAGTREVFRWEHFKVNGVPTIALTHGLSVPSGDAFLVLQRQFYVSEGFNCEQALVALVPVDGGTIVVFSTHTSTDEVEGFAGEIKRSIGRGIVATQLEALFARLQKKLK